MKLLLPLLLLALPAAARRGESPSFLLCRSAVDCSAASDKVEVLPRNSYLIAFSPKIDWLPSQKDGVIRDVNALLKDYGFPITAKEIPLSEAKRIMELPLADISLKYKGNSFLATVGELADGVNFGGTDIHPVLKDDVLGMTVFGPTRHYNIDKIGVNPAFQMADPKVAPRRKRAMLSIVLVHEFVHAAHARLLETLISGDPRPGLTPRRVLPIKTATDVSMDAAGKLGISRYTGHMAEGLMCAGGEHHGNMNDEYGGSIADVSHCFLDPRITDAALDNLPALARASTKCTELNYPVSDYFRLPAVNKGLIARYLGKMSAAGCYAACYYDDVTEAAAMAAVKYDPAMDPRFSLAGKMAPRAKVKIPMAPPVDPRDQQWWEQVNSR